MKKPTDREQLAAGVVSDHATYTHRALAEMIGRTPDWVIDHLVDGGCYAKKVGIYFVSGLSFRLWVESGVTQETNRERCQRNGDKRINNGSNL